MVRESPLEHPSTDAVAGAASSVLGRPVATVTSVDEGLNAVYRVRFDDDDSPDAGVLKLATLADDAAYLPEPRLFSLLADAPVPVPRVLATAETTETRLDAAFGVTGYCEGRSVTDVLALSPEGHRRLVSEAGRHLAAIHDASVLDRVSTPDGAYGDLRLHEADSDVPLVVGASAIDSDATAHEVWPDRFAVVVDRVTAGLDGETYTSGGLDRFADLAPVVRDAVAAAPLPVTPPVATLHGDYRPANLVFALADDAAPLVRAVLDFGSPETGDGLFDLALAENALVGVPLGGTDRGEYLARVLRESYAAHRDVAVAHGVGLGRSEQPDAVYRTYLLVARAKRTGAFGYFEQFAREEDEAAVARRFRSGVETLVAGLD